jgi:hypothetical protein
LALRLSKEIRREADTDGSAQASSFVGNPSLFTAGWCAPIKRKRKHGIGIWKVFSSNTYSNKYRSRTIIGKDRTEAQKNISLTKHKVVKVKKIVMPK